MPPNQLAPAIVTCALANWVSQQRAKVIVHTQISKDKYLSQRYNIDANADISFSPELLAKQDLLIVNGASLLSMNSLQQQWLASAVDNGLGLLVLADQQLIEQMKGAPLDILSAFTLTESAQSAPRTYPVWSQSQTLDKTSDVPLTRIAATLRVAQGKVLIADKEPLNVAKNHKHYR
ncbi:hypothetical protein [Thalassotalea sp. ND16A]|uniref:hypothetical protein n=1 Tax=Thalassotalea sp. ND16A TaxID=1535422 RepID=UPI00051A4276|nr:hypothetical protein [Thalassotalea sp. ND16A]KGJ92441.1 hypothetical protein ND16A_1619 [Thalassotalea sp. ND16A]